MSTTYPFLFPAAGGCVSCSEMLCSFKATLNPRDRVSFWHFWGKIMYLMYAATTCQHPRHSLKSVEKFEVKPKGSHVGFPTSQGLTSHFIPFPIPTSWAQHPSS